MRVLSKSEAEQLLLARNLRVGGWNEISDVVAGKVINKAWPAPREALPLYVFSEALLNWMTLGGWTIIQFDNSTAPTDDEIRVFEQLMLFEGFRWDIAKQRTFLFDDSDGVSSDRTRTMLVLVVFFSLLFEWHIHLVSEKVINEERLSLQDGVVYFFGNTTAIEGANTLIEQLNEHPLVRPDSDC